MDLQDFTKKISIQFLEEDQPKVDSEIEFRKLPTWDSLTGMAILATIQDEYGINVPVDDFIKLKTVNELYNYVTKQKK